MRDGEIVGRGKPEEALTGETLSAVYGVPVSVERTESGRLVCAPALRHSAPSMTCDALMMT
jgi:iron complex transport system ATP-binding protein